VSGYSHKLPVLLEKVAGKAKGLLQEIKDKGANDPEVSKKFLFCLAPAVTSSARSCNLSH
jgi:hypothetical protein